MLDVPDAPAGPLTSARALGRHTLTVTFGLLLALALEKLVEWRQHVQLRKEAEANLLAEIRDNRAEMQDSLDKVTVERSQLIALRDVVAELRRANGPLGQRNVSLGLSMATPRDASWQTANATGALGHMPYPQVKKFAAVYTSQAHFVAFEHDMLTAFVRAYGVAHRVTNASAGLSSEALDQADTTVEDALASLLTAEQLGTSLVKDYDAALK